MAKCSYCDRSNPLLRTDSHGLCKKCRAEVLSNSVEEREKIKGNLIYARYLKDLGMKVHHLQCALDSTKKLFKYERLGCPQTSPSPKALKAFLDEKLRDAEVIRQQSEAKTQGKQNMAPPVGGPPQNGRQVASVEEQGNPDSRAPRDHGATELRLPGTRRSRRSPAMFGVWMNRTTPALTEDISPQGLCIRSAALLKPGTRVGVTLDAPEGQVSGEGMVRWAQLAEADDGGDCQAVMGVEFLAPPPELQRYG